jgi:dihydroflavonol-4-reductase
MAAAGFRVRAMTRAEPAVEPGDPPLDWFRGDLSRDRDRREAVRGVRGVVHAAGWVSLGPDPSGQSRRVNVEATAALLDLCAGEGVARFVYTSTLWTTAAGTADRPADEASVWNLDEIGSPYAKTKREAEALVLARDGPDLRTVVLCPGLVVGTRDRRPTSTGLLLRMARSRTVVVPGGGIPVVDARVVAEAHVRALTSATADGRYVVAGPYLSYTEMARLVAQVAGRPRRVVELWDGCRAPLRLAAAAMAAASRGRLRDVSAAAVAGGFLRLYVSGARADAAFGLRHTPPLLSVFEALDDHRRAGRAPWLTTRRPPELVGQ